MEIKNAKDLQPRQWHLFRKYVTKYYKTSVLESNKNPVLNKAKMRLLGESYAERILNRIKSGNLVSYVALKYDDRENGLVPSAFITGYLDIEQRLLFICNLHVIEDCPFRPMTLKGLFTPMQNYAKEHGITRAYSKSDLLTPNQTDSLEILGFDQGSLNGTEIPYGFGLTEVEIDQVDVPGKRGKGGKRIAFNRNTCHK